MIRPAGQPVYRLDTAATPARGACPLPRTTPVSHSRALTRRCAPALALAVALPIVALLGDRPPPPLPEHRPTPADVRAFALVIHWPSPAPDTRHVRRAHRAPRPRLGDRVTSIARRYLGVPYSYGGETPRGGFDCSGFTRFVYGRLGIDLPHNAAAQYALGRPVGRSRLRPGDLVFFRGLGHVGVYLGRGRMIHAPQSGERVEIQMIAEHGRYVGARRITRPARAERARDVRTKRDLT